jgi:hypothetical protein
VEPRLDGAKNIAKQANALQPRKISEPDVTTKDGVRNPG